MRKTILMSLLGVFLLAGSAAAAGAVAPEAVRAPAADEGVLPELCPAADAEAAPEAAAEVAVDAPQPLFVCEAGACSDDRQCQKWLGSPSAFCVREPGHGCGYCIDM
ncbi:MAG TPA: hypothetical protein VHQ65_07910 [Thermoanaerobaculia bacterium]|nr:hypothetical protein [Thermoanaerobaculia bacterium]